jgi:hypothetical protein
MKYRIDVKTARMGVVRDALSGGRLRIFDDSTTLASVPLNNGQVTGDRLAFSAVETVGTADGTPTHAELVDGSGVAVVTELVVGFEVLLDAETIYRGQSVRVVSIALRHA